MNATTNRQWRVLRYPAPDEPVGREHFEWTSEPVPAPNDGEFLVRTICLATGPAQRGYLSGTHSAFVSQVPIGAVMRGRGVGQVIESQHPDFAVGDIFVGSLGWQDYSIQVPRGAEFVFSTRKPQQPIRPLTTQLGVLGQAGATAYFGLFEAGQFRRGDAVLVSAAAGGVGSTVGQLARIGGARQVVGLSSSDDKCRWLTDVLGFDAAINYRSENLGIRLGELFPEGIDVFFDNVGGTILDTALLHLATGARIAIAGFIATDYAPDAAAGPGNYKQLVYKRARMQGFVVFDYWERFDEAEAQLLEWYECGELQLAEDVDEGLECMPDTLASLFTGTNRGVKLCRVSPDPDTLPGE